MKCPKCGYLGFEQAERCRNCGYEFALVTRRSEPELSLRGNSDARPLDDLDLVDGASAAPRPKAVPRTPTPQPKSTDPLDDVAELPLFTDEAPLITKASPPRPPLAVRRGTPDTPSRTPDTPPAPRPPLDEPELEMPLDAPVSPAVRAHDPVWSPAAIEPAPAGLGLRVAAAAIDLGLIAIVDLSIVYLTMQVCGLSSRELHLLPVGPFAAFLIVQNGAYLVAFTAGGQTIGKMVTGIKVVAAEPGQVVDLGRALQRTLLWALMTLPLGLGLLSALLTPDRRGFHDRVAGTKVVRATAA